MDYSNWCLIGDGGEDTKYYLFADTAIIIIVNPHIEVSLYNEKSR